MVTIHRPGTQTHFCTLHQIFGPKFEQTEQWFVNVCDNATHKCMNKHPLGKFPRNAIERRKMPAHLKDASVRKRRNRASTRAALLADHDVEAPPLPGGFDWHTMTKRWWERLWSSPMATEYLTIDTHGLYRVAMLLNDFWLAGTASERAEIQVRLEKADAEYGTNPLARRRLEWQIAQTEDAQRKGRKRPVGDDDDQDAPAVTPAADPRLRLVAAANEGRTTGAAEVTSQ
jgi:hypothetical protein